MVNRVILIGNLGKDPEVRRLENGAVVAKFSVATNENYKDRNGEWQSLTEWHEIVVWRSLAERAESQLTKGAQVYVEGKLTHRTWQDKDGNNRRTTEVVANYFRAINRREGGSSGNSGGYFPGEDDEVSAPSNPPAAKTETSPATSSPEPSDNNSSDDDLPF